MSRYGTVKERQKPTPVIDGIWMWSLDYGDGETFFNSYLLQTSKEESVLLDPLFNTLSGKPLFSWSVFDELPAPTAIWLTSSDHERDSKLFSKHFQIPVKAPQAEAKLMSLSIDVALKDQEDIDGGWEVYYLKAQKTPAECVFYHLKRELLIIGDAILEQGDGRLRRPYDEPSYSDEEKSQQGIQLLADLPVQGVLPGHGDPVFKNAQKLLKDALTQDPRIVAQIIG